MPSFHELGQYILGRNVNLAEIAEFLLRIPHHDYIFPRVDEENPFQHQDDEKNLNILLKLSLPAYLRDLDSARRHLGTLVADFIDGLKHGSDEESTPILSVLSEALQTSGQMRIATTRANGWMLGRLIKKDGKISVYGRKLHAARNAFPGQPHAFGHLRRLEAHTLGLIYTSRKLRHGAYHIWPWMNALGKMIQSHDEGQMCFEVGNTLPGVTRQPTKAGHAAEAALIATLTQDIYQFEGQMSVEETVRTTAAEELADLIHNEPEKLPLYWKARVQAKDVVDFEKLWQTYLDNFRDRFQSSVTDDKYLALFDGFVEYVGSLDVVKDFYEKWRGTKIDPLSMTKGHEMLIHIMEKLTGDNGFDNKFQFTGQYWRVRDDYEIETFEARSRFGFDPDFEVEHISEIISAMQDQRTIRERLKLRGKLDFQGLKAVIDVFVRADKLDMYSPPLEAILKKLRVWVARTRPWFEGGKETWAKGVALGALFETIKSLKGNLSKDEGASDWLRAIWEIVNEDNIDESTPAAQSRHVKKQDTEYGLMQLLYLRKFSLYLMQGDLSLIKGAYEERKNEIYQAWLTHADYDILSIKMLLGRIKDHYQNQAGNEIVLDTMATLLQQREVASNRMKVVIDTLDREYNDIETVLREKDDGTHGEIKIYSTEEIEECMRMTDTVITNYCRNRNVSAWQRWYYQYLVDHDIRPPHLPFHKYDSASKTGIPMTYMQPGELALSEYKRILDAVGGSLTQLVHEGKITVIA